MTTSQRVFPEDVLIATLYRVGQGVRIADNQQLSDIFNDAATNGDDLFSPFKSHPIYGYSRALGETLQTLDHAGSIVRENAAQLFFRPTVHTTGPFGKGIYEGLAPAQRAAVDAVASRIRQSFGATDAPTNSRGDEA